jgi:hypothetical protein
MDPQAHPASLARLAVVSMLAVAAVYNGVALPAILATGSKLANLLGTSEVVRSQVYH